MFDLKRAFTQAERQGYLETGGQDRNAGHRPRIQSSRKIIQGGGVDQKSPERNKDEECGWDKADTREDLEGGERGE